MNKSARMQSRNTAMSVQFNRVLLAGLFLLICSSVFAAREIPAPSELININSAGAAEIAIALPGIGPQKAQRIIEWRNKHGPFQTREQLLDVKGIGPKTLEKIEGRFHFGDSPINLGNISSQQAPDRWVLHDIIERANHDRLVALGKTESVDSAMGR